MYGSKYTCGKQYDPRFRPWFLTVRQRKPYEAVCVSVRARVRADGSRLSCACVRVCLHGHPFAYLARDRARPGRPRGQRQAPRRVN